MPTGDQSMSGSSATAGISLQTLNIRVERKNFTFEVRENPRGRFLRITEEVNGRRDTVIVPLTGVEQFRDTLNEVCRFTKTLPPPTVLPA
jgi:hypothetical protein